MAIAKLTSTKGYILIETLIAWVLIMSALILATHYLQNTLALLTNVRSQLQTLLDTHHALDRIEKMPSNLTLNPIPENPSLHIHPQTLPNGYIQWQLTLSSLKSPNMKRTIDVITHP